MLSDAALAIAVDAETKWLYNAARRLRRPLQRTHAGATWWRLTHHLSGRLGIQLADAARAADTLLAEGSELSRVRLRATPDDSVGVSVDLARFHDGAAIAIAGALHLAVPRRRGRPSRKMAGARSIPERPRDRPLREADVQLSDALSSLTGPDGVGASQLLSALAQAAVPTVIVGSVARAYHGLASTAESIDLVADFSGRHSRSLSQVLNHLRLEPRGVGIRESFTYDVSLVRSCTCLALRFDGFAVNIERSLTGIGEFAEVREASEMVALDAFSCRVISREALAKGEVALAPTFGRE